MHYLLVYSLSADYLARRPEFRAAHLSLAWQASDRGELVLGGAVTDLNSSDPDTAILLFSADSPTVAEAFARADPYVIHGLVSRWQVRQWITVVGDNASTPIRLD